LTEQDPPIMFPPSAGRRRGEDTCHNAHQSIRVAPWLGVGCRRVCARSLLTSSLKRGRVAQRRHLPSGHRVGSVRPASRVRVCGEDVYAGSNPAISSNKLLMWRSGWTHRSV